MSLRQAVIRLALAGLAAGAVWWGAGFWRPVHHPPGVLVRDEPAQIDLPTPKPPISKDGWTLKPMARYTIQARVLGRERYGGDDAASLSPYDLALGWGPMSDESVLERLDISQGNRYYHWRYWGSPPVPEIEIVTHSANVHVIPADAAVQGRIAGLRVGSLVRLSGYLVEATHPGAASPWRSSLRRDDRGDGACELFYVDSVVDVAGVP